MRRKILALEIGLCLALLPEDALSYPKATDPGLQQSGPESRPRPEMRPAMLPRSRDGPLLFDRNEQESTKEVA